MGAIKCCMHCTTDRHIGCHSTCKRYINEKAEYDKKQARIRKEKELRWDVDCYVMDGKMRIKKGMACAPVRKKKVKE